MTPGLGQHQSLSNGRPKRPAGSSQQGMPGGVNHAQTDGIKRARAADHPGIGVRLQPPAKRHNHAQPSQSSPIIRHKPAGELRANPRAARAGPPQNHTERGKNSIVHQSRLGRQGGQNAHLPEAPKGSLRSGNRLGQRARRALAAKMHGSNAKHIMQDAARSNGAPLRGAGAATGKQTGADNGAKDAVTQDIASKIVRGSAQNHDRGVVKASKQSSAEAAGAVQRGVVDESHPSWVAKRQQKAQLRVKPKGRKTVFSDDGGKEEIVGRCASELREALVVKDGKAQSTQVGHDASGQGRRPVNVAKYQTRGKSWGDAGRGTVEELLPAEPVQPGQGANEQRAILGQSKQRDSSARTDVDAKMKGFHPSWIAAKQRKAQLAKLQELSKASAGNKIKFDD